MFLLLCCETIDEKKSDPVKSKLTQKQQIIKLINFRIRITFDKDKEKILRDIRNDIISRIPD
jgi:hypothetical protein